MGKEMITRCLLGTTFLLAAFSAHAADPQADPVPFETPSAWTVDVGAYAFVPISIQGTSTVNGGAVDLDLGPDEIFDLLQFAISGRAEAWRDQASGDGSGFGFVFDGQYVNLGLSDASILPGGGTVKADIRQGIVDMLAGYRFPLVHLDPETGQAIAFDITAGARYNFLRQKIKVTPGLPAPFTANLGGDRNWVEPVLGARANWIINDRWNFVLRGDASGFNIDNNMSWSVTGVAGWRAWDNTTLRFGYRVFDMDYSDGAGTTLFAYDVIQHGPFMGVSYRF